MSTHPARSGQAIVLATLAICALVLTGCPSQQIIAKPPTVADADDQQSTCKVAKDPLNPLVVEWPGTAKVDLEAASRRGLVAVAYSGCSMKILSGCEIKGGYDLEKTTPARDRLEIGNTSDLYAKLPLGAASLKGELGLESSLELDYIAVGQRIANKQPAETVGECAGATHYIRSITIGAFKLDAKAKGKAGIEAGVGNAGAGVSRDENTRNLRSQGDVEKCQKDAKGDDCGAILQLGLAPLGIVSNSGKLTTGGFGAGLDPIAQVYEVKALGEIDVSGSASLRETDVDFLRLLQTAKRADKDEAIEARVKARAWDAVFRYETKGTNPWKDRAKRRSEEWTIVAEQEERQREALQKLKERFYVDKRKLEELLAMDVDVVTSEQKAAYKKEFFEVYATRARELKMIGITFSAKGEIDLSDRGSGDTGPKGFDPTKKDKKEEPLGKGVAGFGFFAIEAEVGLAFTNAANVSVQGKPSNQQVDYGGDEEQTVSDGAIKMGNIFAGVMISTPELIPGGFGFYGSFKAFGAISDDNNTQGFMNAAGGIRWDLRASPRSLFTLGAGGGYSFTPGKNFFIDKEATDTNDDGLVTSKDQEGNAYAEFQAKGPLVDVWAGYGYSNRVFIASFRAFFNAVFLQNGDGDAYTIDGPLIGGGFGGTAGFVL